MGTGVGKREQGETNTEEGEKGEKGEIHAGKTIRDDRQAKEPKRKRTTSGYTYI